MSQFQRPKTRSDHFEVVFDFLLYASGIFGRTFPVWANKSMFMFRLHKFLFCNFTRNVFVIRLLSNSESIYFKASLIHNSKSCHLSMNDEGRQEQDNMLKFAKRVLAAKGTSSGLSSPILEAEDSSVASIDQRTVMFHSCRACAKASVIFCDQCKAGYCGVIAFAMKKCLRSWLWCEVPHCIQEHARASTPEIASTKAVRRLWNSNSSGIRVHAMLIGEVWCVVSPCQVGHCV